MQNLTKITITKIADLILQFDEEKNKANPKSRLAILKNLNSHLAGKVDVISKGLITAIQAAGEKKGARFSDVRIRRILRSSTLPSSNSMDPLVEKFPWIFDDMALADLVAESISCNIHDLTELLLETDRKNMKKKDLKTAMDLRIKAHSKRRLSLDPKPDPMQSNSGDIEDRNLLLMVNGLKERSYAKTLINDFLDGIKADLRSSELHHPSA